MKGYLTSLRDNDINHMSIKISNDNAGLSDITTVLQAKNDSDIIHSLQSYQGLKINRSLVC